MIVVSPELVLEETGFEVIRELGAGGMGVVFEAQDTRRRTRVALKVLRNPAGNALLRFKREFRALQDIRHPNLVSLGELIEAGGTWFFTMELVRGVDFRAYVRPGERELRGSSGAHRRDPDEARLRRTLGQVASGLAVLHDAGRVHRDIKPSNVLVEVDGRAVILDLGLVAAAEHEHDMSGGDVVGTALYMAPEQAASAPATPAADVYALGVMLYEALTGTLPFEGASLQVLLDKQRGQPPSPSTRVRDLPADLEQLCLQMLRFEPGERPSCADIARQLGVPLARAGVVPGPIAPTTQTAPFVGREPELRALGAALASSAEHAVTVLVRGESGVGKSALVRRFTELEGEGAGVVTLAGRCHERESVPYKAVDGIMDALARYMSGLTPLEAAELVPLRAGLLPRVFPVLRKVDVLATARLQAIADPQELRTKLFAAVRELFNRLTDRRRVILVVDDLQWADADSLALLAEILRMPDEPKLLLVATWRGVPAQLGAPVQPPALPGDVRELEVRFLPSGEARELAEALLTHAGVDAAGAPEIAREAAGHPLFIDALVRHAALDGKRARRAPAEAATRIEDALWSIVAKLETEARRVLELVVVGGVPLPQQAIARAAGIDLTSLGRHVGFLRVANLVRTSGASGQHAIEAYHDRIRATVLAHLSDAERVTLCRRLAGALEASLDLGGDADPEVLSVLFAGAGDDARSAAYAVKAAERAERAVAFDRAVRLYRTALERWAPDEPARRAIRIRLGDALANAGHGHQAATTFLAATDGATAGERLELQKRAAEQLLRAGHVREGIARLRDVLKALGIRYPKTRARAFVSFLVHRLQLRLRGLGFRRRDPSQVTSQELALIDLYAFVATNLSNVDSIVGMGFTARLTLIALRAGEPSRVARALATEAGYLAFFGNRAAGRIDRLLVQAERVSAELRDPWTMGLLAGVSAMTSYLLGRFARARELAEEGEALLLGANKGVAWELSTTRSVAMWSMYYTGELAQLARQVPAHLREALDRGDLYAATNSRLTICNAAWLVHDAVEDARREAALGIEGWPGEGYQVQHYHYLVASAQLELYLGDGAAAHRRVVAEWTSVARAMLLRIQLVRIEALCLRGRAAVAAAAGPAGAAEAPARAAFLRDARRCARKIRGEQSPWAAGLADAIDAGAARLEGDERRALVALAAARRSFELAGMRLHAAVARQVEGELLGTPAGAALVDDSASFMRAQGVKRPERIARMILPGLVR